MRSALILLLKLKYVACIYVESRKMVLMNLFAGQQWRCSRGGQFYGHSGGGRRGWEERRQSSMETHTPPHVK